MNKTTIGILTFTAGATIGSVAAWIFVKKKYEKIAQEEIDSVKETYARRNEEKPVEERTETVTEETLTFDDEVYDQYREFANLYSGGTVTNAKAVQAGEIDGKPYVIPPEEFGELEDYDRVSLTWYADSFLTDENDCLIEDVEGIVGFESLTHFGEHEDNSVFVRNERLKCDYEILLDTRKYEDVLKKNPHLLEDE